MTDVKAWLESDVEDWVKEETERRTPKKPSVIDFALLVACFGCVAISFLYSLISKEGEWFQRSGSLLVLFSVALEIRQTQARRPTPAGWPPGAFTAPTLIQKPISAARSNGCTGLHGPALS